MAAKQFLGWIGSSDWLDLSSNSNNGTYRVYRFDHVGSSGLQALRIKKSATNDYYWVGYRNNYEGLNTFTKGAYIIWQRVGKGWHRNKSCLIDTTPGSTNGKNDAPITLGRTYSDPSSDVHITPITVGGSTPTEYIDVVINFGPFPENTAPSGSIYGPNTTDARELVLFSANVTDSDADALAFAWDMGDGTIQDNSPSITHSWNSGGTYQVNLTVSDMKGGSVSLSKSVTVSDPLNPWNTRTSGTTKDLYGITANDTHLVVVGDGGVILRSRDGTKWYDVSPSGNISRIRFKDIIWTGSEFIAVGQDYDSGISPSGWEGVIYTSKTGRTWRRTYETDTADTGLYGVAYDGSSTVVAVGQSATIIRKSDTRNWGSVSTNILSTHVLRDIAYGGGNFVLIGSDDRKSRNRDVEVRGSSDGLIWTDYPNNTGLRGDQDFREIEYLGGAFHAGGFYGRARHSTDGGQNWSTTQGGDRYQLEGFAETNGVYYSVGQNRDNSASDVDVVSRNGIDWTEVLPGALPNRRELIAYKGTFISVGDSGSIRQSGTIKASVGYGSF
jgi:PKD repeat protein